MEIARDFFANYLPETITAVIDLDTLALQPDSFIDTDLQEQFADLLYSVNVEDGQKAYIYALLEHKSYPDPDTPFQLLRYLVRIWERDQRNKEPLRPIIPIVVYHGRVQWSITTDFSDLFTSADALRPYWPAFRYEIQDLSSLSDTDIRGEAHLQIGLLILKYIFAPDLRDHLGDILSLFNDLAETSSPLEYLRTVLYYIGNASKHLEPQDMVNTVQTLLEDGGNEIMQTVADYWIEQGIEQGVEQGIEQGIEQGVENEARRIAKQLLSYHSVVTVSELTGLSIDDVQELKDVAEDE